MKRKVDYNSACRSTRMMVIEWMLSRGYSEEECAIAMGAPDFIIEIMANGAWDNANWRDPARMRE